VENSTTLNCSGGVFGCVGGILAGLVAAVAVVTSRDKVAEVDGVERVQRLGQVMVVGFALVVVLAQEIVDTTKRAFPSLIGLHEHLIVVVNVTDLAAQCDE